MPDEPVLDPEEEHLVEIEPPAVPLAARAVQRGGAVVGGKDVDERRGVRAVRLLRQPAEEARRSPRGPVNVPAIVPSPGTTQVASRANTSRSARPRFRANASKMRRTSASFSARPTPGLPARLPAVDEALDVPALRVAEVEQADQAARLVGIVVRDRGLEVLALGRRLPELPCAATGGG